MDSKVFVTKNEVEIHRDEEYDENCIGKLERLRDLGRRTVLVSIIDIGKELEIERWYEAEKALKEKEETRQVRTERQTRRHHNREDQLRGTRWTRETKRTKKLKEESIMRLRTMVKN